MDQHYLQPCSDEDWRHCSTPETSATLPWSEFIFPATGGHSHLFRSLHTENTCSRSSLTGATVAFSKNASVKARSCKKMLRLSQNPSTSPGCTTLLSHSNRREYVSPFLFLFLLLSFFFCFFLKSYVSSLGWICPWHLCGCCTFLETLPVSTNSGHMIHLHFVKILDRLFSHSIYF